MRSGICVDIGMNDVEKEDDDIAKEELLQLYERMALAKDRETI
jgi:hypothetical protein